MRLLTKAKLFCILFLMLLFLCSCGKVIPGDQVIIGELYSLMGDGGAPSVFFIQTETCKYYIFPSSDYPKDKGRQYELGKNYVASGRIISDPEEISKYTGGYRFEANGQYFLMNKLQEYSTYDVSRLSGKQKLIATTFRVAREMKGDYSRHLLDEMVNYKKTQLGYSRLHLAVYEDDIAVKQLLAEGNDVNVKNNAGETPLSLAVEDNNIRIARILIENGANLNMTKPSLLEAAISNNSVEMVELLVRNNIDVNLPCHDGSALYCAVTKPNYQITELLLKYGAAVDIGEQMNTPLIAAIDKEDYDLVEVMFAHLLLKHGADVNKKGGFWGDQTPLHIAVRRRNPDVIRLLLKNGADRNIKDRNSLTPEEIAIEEGYSEGVDILKEADNGAAILRDN
ncbi:MAG: ankyrin repeat domain-containing protein [Candidatus Omnitrophota bacterium]